MKTKARMILLLSLLLIFSLACSLTNMLQGEEGAAEEEANVEISELEAKLTSLAEEAEVEEAAAQAPTATPEPSPTMSLPTSTPFPTFTPAPVATLAPANPGLITEWDYYTEFESDAGWYEFYISPESRPEYTTTYESNMVVFEIETPNTYVYNIQDDLWYYEDEPVYVEAEISTVSGVYDNNLGVVCRVTEDGWYEFMIRTNGYWDFWRYDEEDGYINLGYGGSWSINMKHKTNVVGMLCDGDEFTLYINGTETKTYIDDTFSEGQTGYSVGTLEYGEVEFEAYSFTSVNDLSLINLP